MRMIFQSILLSSSSPYRGIHVHKAQSNNVKVIWLVKKYYLQQITQTSPILLFAAFPSSFHAFSYGRKCPSDFNWNMKWGFCVKRHTSVLVRKKLKCHHHLHKRLLFLYKIPDISGTINKLKYVQAAPVSLHVICEKLTFDLHHPFTRTSPTVSCRPGEQVTCWQHRWIPLACGPCINLCRMGSKVDGWCAASCSLNYM